MRYGVVGTILAAAFLSFCFWGCAGLRDQGPAAEKMTVAVPAATIPAPKPALVLDPREERRLVKDLLRDVDTYHRFLKEKNVEQASQFVDPERRAAFQDDLWDLVARYKIESADVVSHQLFPQSDGAVMASVKVTRTLFARNSVSPEKSELWMSWEHRGNRWVLRPQEKK